MHRIYYCSTTHERQSEVLVVYFAGRLNAYIYCMDSTYRLHRFNICCYLLIKSWQSYFLSLSRF